MVTPAPGNVGSPTKDGAGASSDRRGRDRPGHLTFLALLGAAGWALLVLARVTRPAMVPGARHGFEIPLLLFFGVIAGSRLLAFRLTADAVVSLDSAFYIAALACLGSTRAGGLVALILTVDALSRVTRPGALESVLIGSPVPGGHAEAGPERLAGRIAWRALYVLYFGGMTGALLLAVGRLFHVDDLLAVATFPMEHDGGLSRQVLWRVPAIGLTFLVLHYGLQAVRLWLAGFGPGEARRMALRGVSAEAKLLPLAVVIVLIYTPTRYLAVVLLGATYLLINYVANRRSDADAKLRERVSELETLNRTARSLSTSLQLHELIEILARETVAVIPSAAVFTISLWDEQQSAFVVDVYNRDRGDFLRLTVARGQGISGWVAEQRQALLLPDLRKARDHLDFGGEGDPSIRSWLGVPLVIYDQVVGVLSVQSHEKAAFGTDHQRLLEALGAQAAVAIQNARLYELATVDGLTGLYVRRYFDTRLREEWRRAQRFDAPFALLILDLDDFKKLNDAHGHPVGDRVLRDVAQVVKRNMRGVDIAARYGGEEFAFILPRTGLVDAHAVGERIRADVAEHRVLHGDEVLRVTVSIGVSAHPESRAADAGALLYRADVALYRAKATGKNRVEVYWPPEDEAASRPSAPPAADAEPAPPDAPSARAASDSH